jgi:hypothetical protein
MFNCYTFYEDLISHFGGTIIMPYMMFEVILTFDILSWQHAHLCNKVERQVSVHINSEELRRKNEFQT